MHTGGRRCRVEVVGVVSWFVTVTSLTQRALKDYANEA